MPLDIYTKEPIVTPSDEHILPCSLGGRLFGGRIIDKTTNDKLGCGIDARLDEALRPIRIIVDARNCEGEPAHPLKQVPGDDGNDYTIESGGRPKPKPQGKAVVLPGGKGLHLDGVSVSDAGELKQMLRKKFRKLKTTLSLDEVVAKVMAQGVDQKVPAPVTQHKLLLWTLEPYRATAKIAFNLLALNDSDLALSAGFDQIRNFVWSAMTRRYPSRARQPRLDKTNWVPWTTWLWWKYRKRAMPSHV